MEKIKRWKWCCALRTYSIAGARETTFVRHCVHAEPRPIATMMGPPRCAGWCTCLWPMNKRMAEDRKRDIRDEVEFRQAQLNAQAQRLRGTVHMYLRDARMFVEQRDEEVARKMLVQKAMMEQRIAVIGPLAKSQRDLLGTWRGGVIGKWRPPCWMP